MDKRANIGFSAIYLLGIIYAILGGAFVVVGSAIFFIISVDVKFIGLIFAGIGSIFFILGIIFIVMHKKKQQRCDQLLSRGQYITAKVADLIRNYNVRIMGRVPYVAIAKYEDANGNVHIFRSRNIFAYLDDSFIGQQIKVYIEDDTYKNYYVDVEEILPTTIIH